MNLSRTHNNFIVVVFCVYCGWIVVCAPIGNSKLQKVIIIIIRILQICNTKSWIYSMNELLTSLFIQHDNRTHSNFRTLNIVKICKYFSFSFMSNVKLCMKLQNIHLFQLIAFPLRTMIKEPLNVYDIILFIYLSYNIGYYWILLTIKYSE